MPKFPEPPRAGALAECEPEWLYLTEGTMLWQVYFREGPRQSSWGKLRYHGPTAGRFDHQLPPPRLQVRGVLYAAEHGLTGLAEVFRDARVIDRSSRAPWLVGFALRQRVRLLDLSGSWPTRAGAGASMAINTGPRARAQRWSQAIYDAYPDAQGVYYPSSMHANRPAVALYERAESVFPIRPLFHRALTDPCLLVSVRNAAVDLGYALL